MDYPDDRFNRPSSFAALGNIYKLKNDLPKALTYFKQAIDFELVYPNVRTNSFLDYSELVVKTKRTDLYEEVEDILLKRVPDDLFPITKYKGYSILSIIFDHKKDKEKASHFAGLAEKYANEQTSGLRYHRSLGVVTMRDKLLDKLISKFKK